MKTDRELLEMAAKAAGLSGYIHEWINGPEFIVPGENPVTWNPLADDGDALRLAVKLRLSIIQEEESVCGDFFYTVEVMSEEREDGSRICMMQSIDENPMQETRRAIVRAAAAIGESMP